MAVLLAAIFILIGSGIASLLAYRRPGVATGLGAGGAVLGCLVGLPPALRGLVSSGDSALRLPWPVPGGEFHVGIDALSAYFLVPIFALSALAATYGGEYLRAYRQTRSLSPMWFCFNLFVASMALVVIARNAVLFMVAWEVMSIAAFFLVTFEHERPDTRAAGWIFLVATHLGAAILLVMFLLLGRQAGSLDFAAIGEAARLSATGAGLIFILAVVGFGTKAGVVPLHIWLPEAHSAAPGHVSALMSGVMIKLGIYGLLRAMLFLGPPAFWWGSVLAILGLAGALLGAALALLQRDLKRVLAYSSIENVGLIVLALGVGVWGLASGHAAVAVLGFAGSLLHIWNHSLMKGLMFLCAGSVMHGTGTKDMERLGGLLKRMPRTGTAMMLGALAMAALPPLNGFVSEWLIYLSMLRGGLELTGLSRTLLLLGAAGVALAGGLAMICFVRIVGIALLGEGRSEQAREAHESSSWMVVPLGVLAMLCVGAAVFPGLGAAAMSGTIELVSGVPREKLLVSLNASSSPLLSLGRVNLVVWLAVAGSALLLRALTKRFRPIKDTTWGCGYLAPTPRMQYTGLSFAELLMTRVFPKSLRPPASIVPPRGLFPTEGRLAAEYPDPLSRSLYRPMFDLWVDRFARLRWVQQGKMHIYVLYFVVMLVVAFAWVVLRRWMTA